MPEPFTWTIWSSVAAGLGAVLGSTIGGRLSRKTKIAEFRQEWINDLREDVAEYIGISEKWIQAWIELNSASSSVERESIGAKVFSIGNQARVISYRIKMRLNPRENPNKAKDEAFYSSLEDLLNPQKLSPDTPNHSWHQLAEKALEHARELLKREWEVTKKK